MDSCSLSADLSTVLLLLAALTSIVRAAAFTTDQRTEFVVVHNRLRQTSPQAAAMNFVVWSDRLEALAIKAAERCVWKHYAGGGDKEFDGVGENIFASSGGDPSPTDITMGWFSEKHNLKSTVHSTENCISKARQCGHYTQMLLATVSEIGCGISKNCAGELKIMVYCEYNKIQMGAMSGQPMIPVFPTGPSCSACPKEMPFCMNGLCISKALAVTDFAKAVDSTVSASSITCQLGCKNCGTRDVRSGHCKCTCGSEGTGAFCETKSADSAAKCSPCTETPPCLNGGTEDKSDAAKCKCTCTSGFLGDRCEMAKDIFESSVKLVIAAKEEFKSGDDVVMPPVSRSLFNSKIWTKLQTQLANALNGFCRASADNFAKCCPGIAFPGAAKVASADHISAKDLKFTESSVHNVFADGSLNLLVHAEVSSSSALCAPAAGAAKYLPQAVLLSAIEAKKAEVSAQLTACCDKVVLKQVEKSVLGSNDVGATGGAGATTTKSGGCQSSSMATSWHLALYTALIWCAGCLG